MKLYGSLTSPYVRKVRMVCIEKGLRYEMMVEGPADAAGNVVRLNPLRAIPVLERDDGDVYFDSIVICEYLDSLNDTPRLYPASGEPRWQALRWHALGDNMLDTLVLWRNERIRPQPQQSPETLAGFEVKTRASVDLLENEAAALGAAPFGIGHVAIGVALAYIDFRFPELGWREGHPKITAWHESFAQRPSARETVPVDE